MTLEEQISLAGHAAMSLAGSIDQQFSRMQSTPVTQWQLAVGARPSFDFAYHDAELARFEALARKHAGATFTMNAAACSLSDWKVSRSVTFWSFLTGEYSTSPVSRHGS